MSLAQGGKLKALLIGNSAYVVDEGKSDAQFASLEPTPRNDVNEVYKALLKSGFHSEDIKREYNLGHDDFVTAVANFASALEPDDKALFYFSGHGFSIGSENYLVPIGFRFGETKETTAKAALSLTSVLNRLSPANTRVVILDACRDEPKLLSHLPKGLTDAVPVRNLIEQKSYGTLIAYASGSGEPADARPVNGMSLYTSVLVSILGEGPSDLQDAILKTKANVYSASGKLQNPAFYDNLQGDFPLVGAHPAPGPPVTEPTKVARFIQGLCTHGSLWQTVNWELRDPMFASVTDIRQRSEDLVAELPVESKAVPSLQQIQIASQTLIQNPVMFPEGSHSGAGPITEPVRSAICEFRRSVGNARAKLEENYGFGSQCFIAFKCDAEPAKRLDAAMLQESLRRNMTTTTVNRKIFYTFHEYSLWLDLPAEFRNGIKTVSYTFPENYLKGSNTVYGNRNPSYGLAVWSANSCADGRSTVFIEMQDGSNASADFNLCGVKESDKIPRDHPLDAGSNEVQGPDPQSRLYREVIRLRLGELQRKTKNLQTLLKGLEVGDIQLSGPVNRVNDLNNGLTDLWLKIAGYGLGTDPDLDNIFFSASAFSRATTSQDYGISEVSPSMGIPRLYARYLELTEPDVAIRHSKRAVLNAIVEKYSNPDVYPYKDFYVRAYERYREGQDLQSEQYATDLKSLDGWLTTLADDITKILQLDPEGASSRSSGATRQ
jgi:hypothetical protein